MLRFALVCLLLVTSFSSALATGANIVLDGRFDDWAALSPAATDPSGDGGGGVDYGAIWVAHDANFLFIRFETGIEVQGDEQQDMRLYIDTDDDSGTGTSFHGIGADLVWDFGTRDGNFRGASIQHSDIGMLLLPTVSSTEFEIAFDRSATPNGQNLFSGSNVRIVFEDTANGDVAPNSGSILYTFDADPPAVPANVTDRDDPNHLRFASYNIKSDGLFAGGAREAALTRVLNAIDADIWVFCEVWNHDANEVATQLETMLPAGNGVGWYAVKRDSGNVIASRYPIIGEWDVSPGDRLTAVRVDLAPDHDRDILVIANHWSCCTADNNRQRQADALVAFIRDAQTPGGAIDLPADTPIVAAGDFNLVGWRQQFDTAVTGDIQDEGTYGSDHAPDWDGSTFDVTYALHTGQQVAYTWRNDNSSYLPGLLDFVFYTGSVVDLGNHFVLDDRTMTSAQRSAAGLQAGDTVEASDHAPTVADFVMTQPTAAPLATRGLRLLPNRPNPFNPRTELAFVLGRAVGRAELRIHDASGRRVRSFVLGALGEGTHRQIWDGTDASGREVASGVYFYEVVADGTRVVGRMALVR